MARDQEDQDSCEGIPRENMLLDQGDVLNKLKMQVRDIKVGVSSFLFRRSFDGKGSCL